MYRTTCTSSSRCGNIRKCLKCSKYRQAHIADLADLLEKKHGPLSLTVLVPELNTQAEIKRLRASFIRRAISPAGIWTVETGTEFNGLHLNILSPSPARTKYRKCKTYSELVQSTSRDAAAYISKQSGMPAITQYAGNLFGGFGQFINFCLDDKACAPVQAAALEVVMSGKSYLMPKTVAYSREPDWSKVDRTKELFYNADFPDLCNPPLLVMESSWEQRQAIMRKHTVAIHAALGQKDYRPK